MAYRLELVHERRRILQTFFILRMEFPGKDLLQNIVIACSSVSDTLSSCTSS